MEKYFKNVKSFEDLKNQFKSLAKKNHPDAGGDVEIMKAINTEYDALFAVWKDRHNATVEPQEQTTETADSTRRQFYTQFGWEGSNHNWDRSLKEVAPEVEKKESYTYRITKGEDTRDGSELWIVRISETLDKDAYIAESKVMRERGGYYSKFKHGFIFRFDPTEKLRGGCAA